MKHEAGLLLLFVASLDEVERISVSEWSICAMLCSMFPAADPITVTEFRPRRHGPEALMQDPLLAKFQNSSAPVRTHGPPRRFRLAQASQIWSWFRTTRKFLLWRISSSLTPKSSPTFARSARRGLETIAQRIGTSPKKRPTVSLAL